MPMPSFTILSSDDDGLQSGSERSTHVAIQCETKAVDVAAGICRQQPYAPRRDRRGASANFAEKVDDNFQSSESTEGLMRNVQDINSRLMLMMENIVGVESSSSWDNIVPAVDMIFNGQSGTSSIGPTHKEVDQLRKWRPETSYNSIPYTQRLQEESCVKDADQEEEAEEACVTPRAKEHRIPPDQMLICPPPPCKKRRSFDLSLPDCIKVRKRLFSSMPPSSAFSSAASSPQYMNLQGQYAAACQVVVNPPDLHTFPACIRALFFHD